jgi:mRNA-degrading endonuclease RelE of RelBE toxin-antitoxin system
MEPSRDWLRFVQIDPFPGQWSRLGLTDDDLRSLEDSIMTAPEMGPVVPGANGLRKGRFSPPGSGRCKSGAYRVFYVYLPDHGIVLLMAIIAKSAQADLTKADKNALAKVIGRLKKLLDQGLIR